MSERGMKKWAPFKALVEQEKYLKYTKDKNREVEKPIVSNEKAEEINYLLQHHEGRILNFTIYKNKRLVEIKNIIKRIDMFDRKIYMIDKTSIYLKDLVNLEIFEEEID